MASCLDNASLQELVVLAEAAGIHVTDTMDKDRVVELLQESDAAARNPNTPPSRSLSPPAAARSAAPVAPPLTTTSADSADAPKRTPADSILSPPARHSPMSFGSPPLSPPNPPALSDILAAGGMRGGALRDDLSSVGADAGTDYAESVAGAGDAGGAGASVAGATTDTDSERQEMVDTFVSVTQEERTKAVQFLEATDWSIDAAINLFMESGGDVLPASSSRASRAAGDDDGRGAGSLRSAAASGTEATTGPPAWMRTNAAGTMDGGVDREWSGGEDESEDEIDMRNFDSIAEFAGLPGLVVPGVTSGAVPGPRGRPSARSGGNRDSSGEPEEHLYPNGYSEDGVRAPLPTMRDRLIGGSDRHGAGGRGMRVDGGGAALGSRSGAAEETDNTDWIFSIPEGLSFPSDFILTRQLCKEQKKWLMINIQDHEEFSSHRLNKDVWSNETILTLLRGNFVFWQRNKTMGQARYYIEKYNLEGQVLPHTAILDPRTGTPLLKVVGFVEPEDLSMALVEFLEENSIDQVKAPKVKTIGMGNIAQSGYGDTPGKDGRQSAKTSPGNSVGTYGQGTRDATYESFGSEEYVYDDDGDEDIALGSSVDGGDINSRASYSSTTVASNPNTSPHAGRNSLNSSTAPTTSPERTSPPHAARGERRDGASPVAEAAAATRGAVESGPWGRGSQEDELRSAMTTEASTTEDKREDEEVPKEPDAGHGVTQVRFRLPTGTMIARRFWLKDRVSLLFQFARTTVEDPSTRSIDLLSGHPPSSLSGSKTLTLEAANLSNTAIMVRWL